MIISPSLAVPPTPQLFLSSLPRAARSSALPTKPRTTVATRPPLRRSSHTRRFCLSGARANAFNIADDVLRRGVQSISDLINVPGFINLDFADVTSVMANAGYAHMGVGSATGKDKAEQAAKMAISSPLLETSIKGAKGILISIAVSPDVSLDDVDLASSMIANEANPDANIIWGVAFDEELEDEMRITIIATGFEKKPGDENRDLGRKKPNRAIAFGNDQPVSGKATTVFEKVETESARKPEPKAEPKPQPKAQPKPAPAKPADDDDDFGDLFAMINSTKNRK